MKAIITFTFINKQPLEISKSVNISVLKSHKTFLDYAKQQLTHNEKKELTLIKADLNDITTATEFNMIPNWFLTCKGKFKFEKGCYKQY